MVRRIAGVLGAGLALFVAVCAVRASRLEPYRADVAAVDPGIANANITTDRFRAALRFPTVSTQDSAQFNAAPFLALHQWLAESFPNVSRRLTREVVANYSLLYTWTGSDSTLDPVLL